MPQTFFDQSALHLYATTTPAELAGQLLIVPTRRAVWYLEDSLRRHLPPGRAQRAPRVLPMEDYVAELADATCCTDDDLSLHLRLYDVLRRFLPNLSFDDYAGWGPILLRDFSLIDQENGDPKAIFEYLSDAQAISRWQLEVGADEAAHHASAAGRYLRFWQQLAPAYHAFREELEKRGLAYPGMAYRAALTELRRRLDADGPAALPFHWFLGLGRLSATEAELIRLLRKHGRADVRLDGDVFYLEDSPCRAGRVFKQATERATVPPHTFGWAEGGAANDLLIRPRAVRALAVANPSVQGRVAGQLVAEALKNHPDATIAIVLPDESLLLPVLYALPEAVPEFNVTMGLSFQATPLFSLIDLLFEVQLGVSGFSFPVSGSENGEPATSNQQPATRNQQQETSFHHLPVTRLLSHPLLRRYERHLAKQTGGPAALFSDLIGHIRAANLVVVPLDELLARSDRHPVVAALFRPWADAGGAVAALSVLHDALRQTVAPSPAPLEGEYLLAFHQLIRKLGRAFAARDEQPSVRAFRLFLNRSLRTLRLPFEGHPIAQVQVMGWLETRALDFDHVIILSCNEGTLPAAKKLDSLLPPDLLRDKRLPTYPDREADTAHQFWRLLQRPARVELLYALPGPDGGTRVGEPSRFLQQLEHDLVPRTGGATTLHKLTVRVPVPERAPDAVLAKTPAVREALRAVLRQSLSPSALNDFVGCSLKFYYKRVARLSAAEEVEEELGANQLGTAVHQVLEELVAPFIARREAITAAHVRAWPARIPELLPRALAAASSDEVRQAPPDQGFNHLLRHVAEQQLRQHCDTLAAHLDTDGPLMVEGKEQARYGTVLVDVLPDPDLPPDPADPLPDRLAVTLYGRVDRLDRLPTGAIRIVDYKTGQVKRSDLNLKKRGETAQQALRKLLTDESSAAAKVRQLWLYTLMQQERDAGPVTAAIVSMRPETNAKDLYLTADLSFLPEAYGLPDTPEGHRQAGEEALGELVRRILDPAEPLRRTDNVQVCEWCDFRRVCAR